MTDVADVKPTVTGMEIKSISTPARSFPYKMQTSNTRKPSIQQKYVQNPFNYTLK